MDDIKQKNYLQETGSDLIRTMSDDLGKKAVPPSKLPVAPQPVKVPKAPKAPKAPEAPKAPAPKTKTSKFVFIGLALFIIIVGTGGFFYWWNYLQPEPEPEPVITHYQCQDNQCVEVEGAGADQCLIDTDCQVAEPSPSLIPITSTTTLGLDIGQLKSAASQIQDPTDFKRILIKEDNQYIDLETLLIGLGLAIPENIFQTALSNYTLFLYNNRLGIVIEINQGDALLENLRNWENTLVNDLRPMLLTDETLIGFTEEFQDNIYQETAIRYMNFPSPDLSLDYAIISDKLIITTSRESMYGALDALCDQVD